MRRLTLVVIAMTLGLTRTGHAADVQVRLVGALVDIQATAAPLQEILARLAQQTGMKVVYDGPPPRQLVTLTLAGRTPPEAVLALFEGLGVNYAMMADRTGLRVDTLLITGQSSGGGASSTRAAAATPAPPPERPRPQRPTPAEADADDDQEDDPARPAGAGRTPGGGAPGGPPGAPGLGTPVVPAIPFGTTIAPLVLPTPPVSGLVTAPSPTPTPSPIGDDGL